MRFPLVPLRAGRGAACELRCAPPARPPPDEALVGGLDVGATSVLSTRAADATVSPVRRLDTRTEPAGAVRPKRPLRELCDLLRDLLLRERAEDERAE